MTCIPKKRKGIPASKPTPPNGILAHDDDGDGNDNDDSNDVKDNGDDAEDDDNNDDAPSGKIAFRSA